MAELRNQDAVKFHRWRLEGCPWGHLLEVGGSKGGPVGEILRAEQRLVLWGLESHRRGPAAACIWSGSPRTEPMVGSLHEPLWEQLGVWAEAPEGREHRQ